jgi:quercetin dioxygenase-like cupin family protein
MPHVQLSDLPEREPAPGYHARFVHSETMTLASWDVDPGAQLPDHRHPHEQICCVLEGRFDLTVGEETHQMGPGSVVVIPPDTPHAGRAQTACRILDLFHPVREDYR